MLLLVILAILEAVAADADVPDEAKRGGKKARHPVAKPDEKAAGGRTKKTGRYLAPIQKSTVIIIPSRLW